MGITRRYGAVGTAVAVAFFVNAAPIGGTGVTAGAAVFVIGTAARVNGTAGTAAFAALVAGSINTFALGADRGIRSAPLGTDITADDADGRFAAFLGADGVVGSTSLFAFFANPGGYRRFAAGLDTGVVKSAAKNAFFSGSGIFCWLAFAGFVLALAIAVKDHFALSIFAVCGGVFELILTAAMVITHVAFVSGGVFLLTGVECHIAGARGFHIILFAVVIGVKITVAALAG